MAIVFECPVCEFTGKAADEQRGQKTVCKACGHKFALPGEAAASSNGSSVSAAVRTAPAAVAAGNLVVVQCPGCKVYGKVPPAALNKPIKCPKCSQSFTPPRPAEIPAPNGPAARLSDASAPPDEDSDTETPERADAVAPPPPAPVPKAREAKKDTPVHGASRPRVPAPASRAPASSPRVPAAPIQALNKAETLVENDVIGLAPMEGEETATDKPAKEDVIEVVDEAAILVEAACPKCKFKGDVPSKLVGKKIKCPRCSMPFLLNDPADAKAKGVSKSGGAADVDNPFAVLENGAASSDKSASAAVADDNPFAFVADAAAAPPKPRDKSTRPAVPKKIKSPADEQPAKEPADKPASTEPADEVPTRRVSPQVWIWVVAGCVLVAVLIGSALVVRSLGKDGSADLKTGPGPRATEASDVKRPDEPKPPIEGQPVVKLPPDEPMPKTQPPVDPKPEQPPDKDTVWVNAATDAAKLGDVRVRVSAAWTDVVKGQGGVSTKKYLLVQVQIDNQSTTKAVDYHTWGVPDAVPGKSLPAQVTDNAGKTYRVPSRQDLHIKPGGQADQDTVRPGQALDDLLVFDLIPDKVEFLRLTLPAVNLGGKGTLGLEIPGSMLAGGKRDPAVKLPGEEGKPPDKNELARVQELLGKMRKGKTPERVNAVKSLGDMGAAANSAVPELSMTLVNDKDEHVRAASAETLGRIGPGARGAINALIRALRDEFYKVRSNAAEALGTFGPDARDAIPRLRQLLSDKEDDVSLKAALALSKIDAKGKLPPKR